MKAITKFTIYLAGGCLVTLGLSLTLNAATLGEPVPGPDVQSTNKGGMSQFQIILRRNIFDSNRGVAQTNQEPIANRPSHIETFSFRGSARLDNSFDGFFIGDGAPASGIVDVKGMINGFEVLKLNLSEATLLDTNQQVVILKDQTGMTRQDGGPWRKVTVPVSYTRGARTLITDDNENGPDFGGQITATDGSIGEIGGNRTQDTGSDNSGALAQTAGPAASVNPAVLASLQARRAAER